MRTKRQLGLLVLCSSVRNLSMHTAYCALECLHMSGSVQIMSGVRGSGQPPEVSGHIIRKNCAL